MSAAAMHAQLPRPVYWNDAQTKSTHAWFMCPECTGTLRRIPLGYECVRCGWEWIRKDTEGK